MRMLVILACLIAVGSGALAHDDPADSPEAKAFKQWLDARVEQAAVVVNLLSEGKSTLLLKQAATVSLAGDPVRRIDWGGVPFVQVFPVSSPFDAVLPELGKGRILGAVAVLEQGEAWPSDVYLLYYGPATFRAGAFVSSLGKRVQMVWMKVESDGSVRYISRVCDEAPAPTASGALATAAFEGSRVQVKMAWPNESYAFSFEEEIIFL